MTTTVGIAGITGRFGGLVATSLLRRSEVRLRGFCRNAAKVPARLSSSPGATIIQGDAYDADAARRFVRGCDVVVCSYLGDNKLMTDAQKVLVDACDVEKVPRYVASDYTLDYTKLEYGQHGAKDPMKHIKAYLETKENVAGVHVLIGAFMETFFSNYFGIFDPRECKFSFYGSGDEIWELTTYGTAAEYVAEVAMDPSAKGMLHFLGDRKSMNQIAAEFAEVYGKKPQLESRGSLDELYSSMQEAFKKDPSNIYAYIAMFYQYYCINGQTYLKKDLDNSRYPSVKPVTFKEFIQTHDLRELGKSIQKLGSNA